jgi:hypothetical protein
MVEQINTTNRYELVSHMHWDDDITGNVSKTDIANKKGGKKNVINPHQ